MALPITIPNTFAAATTSIPLANLDANFTTVVNAINGIGNGSESLANVTITGGSASNISVDFQDKLATRPTLKDYSINGEVLGLLNANTSLNFANANFFSATANANVTISFANASAANTLSGCVLALTNGGSQTLTWSNVAWSGNTAPSLTSNGLDILVFVTYDAGTTVHGMVASYNSYK
jgi:hypothetical protein